MYQKGFAPVYFVISIMIIGVITLVYFKQIPASKPTEPTEKSNNQATSSASISPSGSPTTKANIPKPTASTISTIKVTPKPTTSSTKTPTPTSSPTVSPTVRPTAVIQKNTCDVNIIYGKIGGGDSDPLLVTLVYSFSSHNGTYMTGAQWDFDGNGTWDTDLKQLNGTIEHTYSSGGIYNVKLQLQDSNGTMTDVCSKTVSLAGAIEVSLNGQMFRDLNCNNTINGGEEGIGGAKFTIMAPTGLVYQSIITDQNGNYSFSKRISVNNSLPLLISTADHTYYFTDKTVTLNSQNYSATINIPYCSN